MDIIGLTGGIACGKSTVAHLLRERGVVVVDADEVAREVVEPGSPGLAAVVEAFGPGVLDEAGGLDRKKLGALVFADDDARGRLNRILHPRIAARAQERFAEAVAGGAERVVYEVPLLFENGLDQIMTTTIVVSVDEATQLARLMARDGSTAAEAQARINSQMPLDEKRARADHVIDNGGSRAQTAAELDEIWAAITAPG